MSYTEEEKQRILAEAHGHLERLRHFEPSERSNIIPLRRQREPERRRHRECSMIAESKV